MPGLRGKSSGTGWVCSWVHLMGSYPLVLRTMMHGIRRRMCRAFCVAVRRLYLMEWVYLQLEVRGILLFTQAVQYANF